MPLRPAEISLIIVVVILAILVIFLFFKVFNLSFKVHNVSDFVNGEVFSTRFYEMVQNYFNNKAKVRDLLDPVLSVYTDIKHGREDDKNKIGEIFFTN